LCAPSGELSSMVIIRDNFGNAKGLEVCVRIADRNGCTTAIKIKRGIDIWEMLVSIFWAVGV
jgi:hypothetical protein